MSREEWRIMGLWAVAVLATALLARVEGTIILGSVFFVGMAGSLYAVRRARPHHSLEGVHIVLWLLVTAVLISLEGNSVAAQVLGPVYFVCMVGCVAIAHRAYRVA